MTVSPADTQQSRSAPSPLKKFLNEEQDPSVVQQVLKRVSQILTREEQILYIAVQNKPVVNISPDCVVLTNRRFIIYKPKMLGRADFVDYIWRDLNDAHLKEGLMGATLKIQTVNGRVFSIDYLPKAQARRLYSIAQEMEEEVREERRNRTIEEKRAAAGGVIFQGQVPAAAAQGLTEPATDDPMQKLKMLKQMSDEGLITAEEFDKKKAEILSRM